MWRVIGRWCALLWCLGVGLDMSAGQSHDIHVDSLLTFSSPVPLTAKSGQGIDTIAGEWQGEDVEVRVDSGLFVDPLTRYRGRSNYQETVSSIDGQSARVVAFDDADRSRFTAAHFADIGSTPKKLTVVVISRGTKSDELGRRIIESIRFRR
jgi:hypothetical protein